MRPKVALAALTLLTTSLFGVPKAIMLSGPLVLRWSTGATAYLGHGDIQLQETDKSCGPASLRYLLHLEGLDVDETDLSRLANTGPKGTTILGLAKAAEHYGYQAEGWEFDPGHPEALHPPIIVHFPDHFVVVVKVDTQQITVADPAIGLLRYSHSSFSRRWDGVILIVRKSTQGQMSAGVFDK